MITIEAKECVSGRPYFLFHSKMVIQWHLLHPGHQTFIGIHCKTKLNKKKKMHC